MLPLKFVYCALYVCACGISFYIPNEKALKCKTLGASSLVNYANTRARKLATPRVVAVKRGAVSSRSNKG